MGDFMERYKKIRSSPEVQEAFNQKKKERLLGLKYIFIFFLSLHASAVSSRKVHTI